MNDVEIKDIDGIAASASQLDKLKNLLIEFGVEFEHWDTASKDYVSIKQGDMFTDFEFSKDGVFKSIHLE